MYLCDVYFYKVTSLTAFIVYCSHINRQVIGISNIKLFTQISVMTWPALSTLLDLPDLKSRNKLQPVLRSC